MSFRTASPREPWNLRVKLHEERHLTTRMADLLHLKVQCHNLHEELQPQNVGITFGKEHMWSNEIKHELE